MKMEDSRVVKKLCKGSPGSVRPRSRWRGSVLSDLKQLMINMDDLAQDEMDGRQRPKRPRAAMRPLRR